VNTTDIADKVAVDQSLTKASAKALVEAVLKAITEGVITGEDVSLPGFGKFKVKESPAREGRNPQSGETIQIAASKKLSFVPAKAVKDVLNAA
jgi:DNA-binding protein HU-beta